MAILVIHPNFINEIPKEIQERSSFILKIIQHPELLDKYSIKSVSTPIITFKIKGSDHVMTCQNTDEQLILALVKKYRLAIQYASIELKGNRKIVMAAVKQDLRALYCVSGEIRNDKTLILAALKQNRSAFQYVSTRLQRDRDVSGAADIIFFIRCNCFSFSHIF